MQRIGLYAWGGPGTIRLLNVKYHSPHIEETSFMRLYDASYLEAARHKLNVTDMWVTYSWGFSDHTEQPDRQYIVERLPHFHQYNIAPYAYIQGLNVVTSEFNDRDIFCHDSGGRLLPYSKGRSLTCPNKPAARRLILERVQAACQEDFAGIFVDNILFGLPPFYFRRDYTSFFGCSCDACRRAFRQQFGYALPVDKIAGEAQLSDYLAFRCRSIFHLLQELAEAAHAAGKTFGINLYDPYWYTPEIYFGYQMNQIKPLLDYYVIENYALGRGANIDNRHLTPLITSAPQKPTFVISYRNGIGYDSAFGQQEVDLIWSEAASLGYAPCLKATEYKTKGIWHALDLSDLTTPVMKPYISTNGSSKRIELKESTLAERNIVRFANRHYVRMAQMTFENKSLANWIERTQIMTGLFRRSRRYNLGIIHPGVS